jgi:hypothetical protein
MVRRIFERLPGAVLVDLVHMPANGLTHQDADDSPGDGCNRFILAVADLRACRSSDDTAENGPEFFPVAGIPKGAGYTF